MSASSGRRFACRLLLAALLLVHAVGAIGADPSLARAIVLQDPTFALTGLTLIDGTGDDPRHQQSILVSRGVIVAVGDAASVAIPDDARVMPRPGRTVIPGIVGMHNHTHMPGLTFMPDTVTRLSLASGVTTIRTAGAAQASAEIRLAAAIENGDAYGPRILASAPYVTGPGGNTPMDAPATPSEARVFVRHWAALGATWIKLYRQVQPEIAAAIIDEAHRAGLKVAGHLCSLTFREAAELGIDSIEHGLISASDFVPGKPRGACVPSAASIDRLDLDSEAVRSLIELLVERQVALVATPAIIESHFAHRPQADQRSVEALSAAWREAYRARQARLGESAASSRFQPPLLEKLWEFERRFVAAGGLLAAGPDPGRHVLPGYGDQRNFELLVESGFSVPQAVRIMTANGARILGASERFGVIRPGLQADLVVLDGDLQRDPSIIRNPELVLKGGVGFDPQALIAGLRGRVGPTTAETSTRSR